MRSVTRVVAVAVAAVASVAAAQDKVDLNTITKVQVNGGSITIAGTKKPNFTTFTMTDPARLVIDISEAVFSGVADEQQVGNGVVTAIKTASYGSDASSIARVLIGFEKEYETDIQAEGSTLVVKVLGAGGGGEAVAQADPGPSRAEQEAAEKAAAEEAAREKAEADRQEAAQAAADKAAADKAAREQAEAERKAAAEQKKQEALTAKQAAEEERKRKAEEAAAEREAKRQEQLAAEEERTRLAEEAAAEREAKRQEALAAREQQRVAMAESRSGDVESSSSLSVSNRRKTMTFVGFKQEPGAQRVYVRTNEPVRYSLQREGKNQVVLELENTSIGLTNNSRSMDTSFFNGAVAMVDPQPGPTRTVRIEIKLKENVPYEARQEGNEVYVDFQTGR